MISNRDHGVEEGCPHQNQLDDLIDERLDRQDEERLIRHIDECQRCRAVLDQNPFLHGRLQAVSDVHESDSSSHVLQETLQQLKQNVGTMDRVLPIDMDMEAWAKDIDGFEVIRCLGQGGMGVVLLAREISLDRMVAIKMLAPSLARDETAKQRFLREARAAASVNHPHVVTIHSVVESASPPFLVMEYVDGESLLDRLGRSPKLDWSEIVGIGRQLASALTAAHDQGLIHRDIKPANVLIDSKSGQVKLGDFGLARAVNQSQLTRTGVVVGTPEYLAPEWLVEGTQGDHRADLFSLGSLLYTMCCGNSPFASDSVLATLYRIAKEDPVALVDQSPETPAPLIAIIEQLLQKNPDDRIQSAMSLDQRLQALERMSFTAAADPAIAQDLGVPWSDRTDTTEAKKSAVAGSSPFTRRRKWLAAAVFGVLVMGLASWWLSKRPTTGIMVQNAEAEVIGYFDTLEQAIADAPGEATVVIRGDGPHVLESTYLWHEELRLVAADGSRPAIHLEPNDSMLDGRDADEVDSLLQCENRLVLEGLDLLYSPDEERSSWSLIGIQGGELVARRCRFRNESQASCLILESAGSMHLESSLIHGAEGFAIEVLALDADENDDDNGESAMEAWLENCIVASEGVFLIESEEQTKLNLDRCTLIASSILQLEVDPGIVDDTAAPTSLVSLTSRSCLMASELAILGIATMGEPFAQVQLPRLIGWHGTANRYWGPWFRINDDEDVSTPDWLDEWSEWCNMFEETESEAFQSPDVPFEGDWLNEMNALWENPKSFNLDGDQLSGLGTQNVGVDWKVLGW